MAGKGRASGAKTAGASSAAGKAKVTTKKRRK